MSKILITGNRGFIASKLETRLASLGHEVHGYDIVDGKDLLILGQLDASIRAVDVVYHIAAQADLTKMQDIEEGHRGVRANVEATDNVAFLCAKYHKRLIHASTVCVYGNTKTYPEEEDTTLPNPSELYACSKYAAEWIIKGYGKNFGLDWTILRFATIYGEGMRPALGMYIFFKQAMKGAPITVHGDGKQDRTLTYIDDLVDGLVLALDQGKGEVINLTAEESISAIRMAHNIASVVGNAVQIQFIDQRPNQTIHEDFSTEKAREILGWRAKTSWEEGLKQTFEWMKTQVEIPNQIKGQGKEHVSPTQ